MSMTTMQDRLAKARRRIDQLKERVSVADAAKRSRSRLQLDVLHEQERSEDRDEFVDAVNAELHEWDTYLERLQTDAVINAGKVREQAEAAISDVRARRIKVGRLLKQVTASSGEDWHAQKKRVTAAREELQQKADELSAKFH